MDNKIGLQNIWKRLLSLIRNTLYPLTLCYSYFVIIGIDALSEQEVTSTVSILYFIGYHVILMYTIVLYMRIFPTEDVSTRDFFHKDAGVAFDTDHLNMFVAEIIKARQKRLRTICSICKVYKPPRSQHCMSCNRCYLKTDHHSYYVDICFGWHNYKYLILFLICNTIFCACTTIPLVLDLVFEDLRNLVMLHYIIYCFIFGLQFFISVFMLSKNVFLIWNNETKIENAAISDFLKKNDYTAANKVFQEGMLAEESGAYDIELHDIDRKSVNPYNISPYSNFVAVFGEDYKQWFLPTFTSTGDGISFVKNFKNEEEEFFGI